jgi:hypothetical protein
VSKPFHIDTQQFGDSREITVKRFDRSDRRFQEYKDLNHMEGIDGSAQLKQESILPHDVVMKPSRSKIKERF